MGLRRAFTLIELLVVIAIIAILAVVVVLTLNPAQLLAQSRDANRVSDLATLSSAISLYQTDQSTGSLGVSASVYTSLPDSSSSTCGALGLLPLPSGYVYHCSTQTNFRLASSSGWLPINFQAISSGAPFGSVPIDPMNSSSSRLYYAYTTNGTQYEVTAAMESRKYKLGGSGDVIAGDGGPLSTVYEKGTKLGLIPLDYGDSSLVGYWPLDEGSGSTISDWSGSGNNGSLVSSPSWVSGKIGSALSFNGTNYASISSTSTLNPTTVTVVAWVNPGTQITNWAGIVSKSDAGGGHSYDLRSANGYTSTTTPIQFRVNGDSADVGGYLTNGIWSFVVGEYDGQKTSLYINGVLTQTNTYSGSLTTSSVPLNIGADGSTGYKFVGSIDDVRVYNRALSPAEIQNLYNGGK